MSRQLSELGLRVDAVIRSVPGVVTLFSADPVLVRTARELTAGAREVALTQLSEDDDILTVTASVGVDGDEQAPAAARTIADAVRSSLPEADRATAVIHIRVSRVTR